MKRTVTLLAAGILLFALAASAAPAGETPLRQTIQKLEALVAKEPANLPYLYVLATYYDQARDIDAVVRVLNKLIELGWDHSLTRQDFPNSHESVAFRKAALSLHAREPNRQRSKPAFKLTGYRDLVPEGIAYDPVDDVFYVSGIHRRNVLRVTRAGVATDFVKEAQDGMLGGLGMKVDARRRLLWVISTATPEMNGWKPGDQRSMLAAYDLGTGKLTRKITATPALLNDLTLLEDGSLFATDMGRGNVMHLAADAKKLEIWASGFDAPNGIAEMDGFLYVADFNGLTKFDLRDKTRTPVQASAESHAILNGIDGLVPHKGTLIAIQNGVGRPRVIRIDPATGTVEDLESRNPAYEIPTTGAIAGDDFYFIANPGLRSFDENHNIWPMEKLKDPVMLKMGL
jgi:sugar lactone lactonase YvrE